MYHILLTGVCSAALFLAHPGKAPDPDPQSIEETKISFNYEVYSAFFKHVILLDKVADQMDSKNENGEEVRSYFQEQIGLTNYQMYIFKCLASECDSDLKREDRRVQLFIEANRPSGLKNLNKQETFEAFRTIASQSKADRYRVIAGHLSTLQAGIGSEAFEKIDTYVKTHFLPNFKITPIPISTNFDPEHQASTITPGGGL